MSRPRVRFIVAAFAGLLLVASGARAQPADPPEKAKARTLLREGVRLLDAGQLAPALRKFEDAYAAFPSAKILVNIGTAQSGLGRTSDAANTYQRYLDSGSDDPVQLPAVRAALAELDGKLGRLAVKVRAAAGAAVEVRVGTAAWSAPPASGLVRVAPGRYEIHARVGAREVNASGTVAAGEHRDVAVDLLPPEAPRPPPPPSPAVTPAPREAPPGPAAPLSADRTPATRWTPLRKGAVAAAAVGVTGVVAMSVLGLSARSMWNDAQPGMDNALADRARSRADLATGAGVVGIAALGTATVLWLVGAPRDPESRSVTAFVDRTQVGVAITGAF